MNFRRGVFGHRPSPIVSQDEQRGPMPISSVSAMFPRALQAQRSEVTCLAQKELGCAGLEAPKLPLRTGKRIPSSKGRDLPQMLSSELCPPWGPLRPREAGQGDQGCRRNC